jgi:hydrogenase expression/formation protein HypC
MCLAVPGRIRAIEGEALMRTGEVEFAGAVERVNLAFVPEAGIGDYVLVHAGVAIARLSEQEAEATLDCLRKMGELVDENP